MAFKRQRRTHARKGVTEKRVTVGRDAKGRFAKASSAVKRTRHVQYRDAFGEFAPAVRLKLPEFKGKPREFDKATLVLMSERERLAAIMQDDFDAIKQKLNKTRKGREQAEHLVYHVKTGKKSNAFRFTARFNRLMTDDSGDYDGLWEAFDEAEENEDTRSLLRTKLQFSIGVLDDSGKISKTLRRYKLKGNK